MNILGVRKGDLQLCEHQQSWADEARQICEQIIAHVGQHLVDVQHVGSTSIRDVRAKPILDFAIGVQSMSNIKELIDGLVSMNYIDRGLGPGSIGHLLVYETSPLFRTQHIHIVEHGSNYWLHYVRFRDHMNSNDADRTKLKSFKEQMHQSRADRKRYQSEKARFVEEVWKTISAQRLRV